MHVLDETSPLYGQTSEFLQKSRATFILSLSGTDETTGQVLMARHEYPGSSIHWNTAFRDIMEVAADGTVHFDFRKFHDIEPLSEQASRGGPR
jgi:inward rectifier potassium channel